MKNWSRRAIAIALFLGLSLMTSAQQTIKATFLNAGDGIMGSAIYGVTQDSYGYLWLAGSNGVQRYDGFSFEHVVNDPSDSTSLLDNQCWNVTEDSKENIWISTDEGFSRYDRATFTIQLSPTNTVEK